MRPLAPVTTTSTAARTGTTSSTSATTSTTTRPVPPTDPGLPLFSSTFDGTDGLVTNEYAYWNPDAQDARVSPDWELTSGSLFNRNQEGWTGAPDTVEPNATSSNGTDSGVFRLTTRRHDFGDVAVSFDLTNERLGFTVDTPPVAWDGVHIFLRYQNEKHLYYASVNRRDGTVVIKKKCVGGTDNGGTYYELSDGGDPYVAGHPIPFGTRQHVGATVRNNADGSVTLTLLREGVVLARATDRGIGCAPIVAAGKVGIRGDNDAFTVDDFTVAGL